MGSFRDAEKYIQRSLELKDCPETRLRLSYILHKSGQTTKAIQNVVDTVEKCPENGRLMSFLAEMYAETGDTESMRKTYKEILHYDSSSIEALTELAALAFEDNQPEIAMRYYRRLAQIGHTTAQTWTNLALCTSRTPYIDQTVCCFGKALACAEDDYTLSLIWYHIAHVVIGFGELEIAYRCLRIAVVADPGHAEAWNDLGVIQHHLKGSSQLPKSHFQTASRVKPEMVEPGLNSAAISLHSGDIQGSHQEAGRLLDSGAAGVEINEILTILRQYLNAM